MDLFSVECESPGGFGPRAVLKYDPSNTYVEDVEYLDLEFEVWLGGELVQHIDRFCVSRPLWDFLAHKVKGVSIRPMTATAGEHVNEFHPTRIIPEFCELVIM